VLNVHKISVSFWIEASPRKPRGIFTVRKFFIFRFARQPRRKQRGTRSVSRFKGWFYHNLFLPKALLGQMYPPVDQPHCFEHTPCSA